MADARLQLVMFARNCHIDVLFIVFMYFQMI